MIARIIGILNRLEDVAILVARIVVGWVFVQSGWGKLHRLPKVIEFFTSLGIPYPELQAPFVASCELVFGALLVAGLLARVAAAPLSAIMLVALATAKKEDISAVSDLFGISEFLYIVMLLWIATHGAGKLSLDALLGKRLEANARKKSQA